MSETSQVGSTYALRRPRNCHNLLWFACCAREVERHAHSDLSLSPHVCFRPGLSHSRCSCSVLLTSSSMRTASVPIAKRWDSVETAPTAPFPCITSLATQHANHNKSGQLRGLTHRLRKTASGLHACTIAHASFFLPSPRAQCSFHLFI